MFELSLFCLFFILLIFFWTQASIFLVVWSKLTGSFLEISLNSYGDYLYLKSFYQIFIFFIYDYPQILAFHNVYFMIKKNEEFPIKTIFSLMLFVRCIGVSLFFLKFFLNLTEFFYFSISNENWGQKKLIAYLFIYIYNISHDFSLFFDMKFSSFLKRSKSLKIYCKERVCKTNGLEQEICKELFVVFYKKHIGRTCVLPAYGKSHLFFKSASIETQPIKGGMTGGISHSSKSQIYLQPSKDNPKLFQQNLHRGEMSKLIEGSYENYNITSDPSLEYMRVSKGFLEQRKIKNQLDLEYKENIQSLRSLIKDFHVSQSGHDFILNTKKSSKITNWEGLKNMKSEEGDSAKFLEESWQKQFEILETVCIKQMKGMGIGDEKFSAVIISVEQYLNTDPVTDWAVSLSSAGLIENSERDQLLDFHVSNKKW
jgi:hypothetical protein